MSGGFSGDLWDGVTDIYDAILDHPFLAGMTDGSLPAGAFTFYVIQDALYLRRYAQALAAVATHAPDAAQTEMFARHAAGIVAVEMSLHDTLLAELDIDPGALAATQGGSYAEGVGTVLPCYWIYGEVGRHLLGRGSPNARYQKWITTYGSAEFDAEVRDVIAVTDGLGPKLSAAERERVHRHFRATSRYEWMFWDMGYRQETWPV